MLPTLLLRMPGIVPLSGAGGGSSTADSLAAVMTLGMLIPRRPLIDSFLIDMEGWREALSKVPVCGPALRNRLEYSLIEEDLLERGLCSCSAISSGVMYCLAIRKGVSSATVDLAESSVATVRCSVRRVSPQASTQHTERHNPVFVRVAGRNKGSRMCNPFRDGRTNDGDSVRRRAQLLVAQAARSRAQRLETTEPIVRYVVRHLRLQG